MSKFKNVVISNEREIQRNLCDIGLIIRLKSQLLIVYVALINFKESDAGNLILLKTEF